MAKTMFVKPAEGRIVPDPEWGDELPANGRAVPRNAYWRRRVIADDVVESDMPAAQAAAVGGDDGGGK
ncbi:DUF2635 domain-containing protein [Burkholderia vietnamiensis]|uniref:DUF2635 domain-containing protein n=1 Tax=Burkholderia vietnamiensis TaxID=60552 RepID=UPI000841A3B6|nr:DUF2635 domain-containing protein [Burkholderia vietnamiensis]AOK40838.1 hypothetical protein WL96_07160 [Burkholderia vietnamiensis]